MSVVKKFDPEKKRTILGWLEEREITHHEDLDLSTYTWFQTGGIVSVLIEPRNLDQLRALLPKLDELEVPFKVVGQTSNLLFRDEAVYSCLVSTVRLTSHFVDRENQQIYADCGLMLPDLSRIALNESIAGFAGMEGIPGTVGGAIFMNAGAYGDEIKSVLSKVEIYDRSDGFKELFVDELELGYRNSILREGRCDGVVLGATFHLRDGDQDELEKKMELVHAKRHKYNEYCYPNLGSAFSGSIYWSLGKTDSFYKFFLRVFNYINYKCKIFRRESPINRDWMNNFTVKRFEINPPKKPYSNKNLNTIINNGLGSQAYIDYLDLLKEKIKDDIPLENEVVDEF